MAFFASILLFELCERCWPARPVNRWKDLKLDVLSFAFALTVNRAVTHLIRVPDAPVDVPLAVAWVQPYGDAPALHTDGTTALSDAAREQLGH